MSSNEISSKGCASSDDENPDLIVQVDISLRDSADHYYVPIGDENEKENNSDGQCEYSHAVFNFCNYMLGACILSAAYVIRRSGLYGFLLFTLLLFGTWITARNLHEIMSKYPHLRSYGCIAKEACGIWGECIVSIVQVGELFGSSMAKKSDFKSVLDSTYIVCGGVWVVIAIIAYAKYALCLVPVSKVTERALGLEFSKGGRIRIVLLRTAWSILALVASLVISDFATIISLIGSVFYSENILWKKAKEGKDSIVVGMASKEDTLRAARESRATLFSDDAIEFILPRILEWSDHEAGVILRLACVAKKWSDVLDRYANFELTIDSIADLKLTSYERSNRILRRLGRKYAHVRISVNLADQNLSGSVLCDVVDVLRGVAIDRFDISENSSDTCKEAVRRKLLAFEAHGDNDDVEEEAEDNDDGATMSAKKVPLKSDDEECALLSSLTALRDLNLAKLELCKPFRGLCRSLSRLSRLEHLFLQANKFGPEGARDVCRVLKCMPNLKRLNLSANEIGIGGAMALSDALGNGSNPKLEHLYLYSNQMKSKGVTALSWALVETPMLERLNLSSNEIGPTGATALSRTLRSLKHLKWLNLMSNKIGCDGIASIAPHLPPTFSLNNNEAGVEGARVLASAMSKGAFRSTKKMWLSGNRFGPEGIRILASTLPMLSNSLNFLDLSNNAIGPRGAPYLAGALRKLVSLKRLAISQNQLTSSGQVKLSAGLESLEQLEHLNFCEEKIDKEGAKALSDSIACLRALKELNMFASALGSDGMAFLCPALRRCGRNMRTLKLSFSHIGDSGVTELSNVLPHLPMLEHLELQWNQVTHVGAKSLANAISAGSAPNLSHLNLGWNVIGSRGGTAMARAIEKMDRVETLCLEATGLGPRGASLVAQSLGSCQRLHTLSLGRCGILDEGATALMRPLAALSNLRRLDLRSNRISEKIRSPLVETLRGRTVLLL
eukprot:g272.t1